MQAGAHRKVLRWLAAAAVGATVGAGLLYGFATVLKLLGSNLLEREMRERFGGEVQYRGGLHVSILPPVTVVAENLEVRQPGRTGPPLIRIRRLTAEAGLIGILRNPKHVRRLRFEGLEIQIPPESGSGEKTESGQKQGVVVEEIVADGSLLRILPDDPHDRPLTFDIHRLKLNDVGPDQPLSFRALLRNATPPGLVRCEGRFGPFHADDAGASPVSGNYTLERADLSVFHGISGTLSSMGHFVGTLRRMDVDGTTRVPDFAVTLAGHRLNLTTEFHANVDGATGDVLLKTVNAHFLESTLQASGAIASRQKGEGKTLSLNASVNRARVQDVLLLALKKKPAMSGAVSFRARIVIPPGQGDVVDKLRIQADFGIGRARFRNPRLQQQIAHLSDMAKGDPKKEPDPAAVLSDFKGAFNVEHAEVRFSRLGFRIPGGSVTVSGTYALRSEALDLNGIARADAKPSQMTTGIKSFLMKALDPFFKRKKGRTEIPIHIGGTQDDPKYDFDLPPN